MSEPAAGSAGPPLPDTLPPAGWSDLGPLPGGYQSPVHLVRQSGSRDGSGDGDAVRHGVLKWAPVTNGPRAAARQSALLRDLDRARGAGLPVPAWLAHGVGGQLQYHIAEYVHGVSEPRLSAEVARALIDVLESQRGLGGDPAHCWSTYAYGRLLERRRNRYPGPPRTGPTRTEPPRTGSTGTGPTGTADTSRVERAFGRALDALLDAVPLTPLPTGDLVHGDFRLGNVLFGQAPEPATPARDGRAVVALVDIEAAGGGTRALDYATLLTEDDIAPDAWELVRTAGAAVAGPEVLALCFACAALELSEFVRARAPGRFETIGPGLTARLRALTPAATRPRTRPQAR